MVKAIKSLGQNFLQNQQIVSEMVDLLNIKENSIVIEIGPGPGIFTKEIVSRLNDSNKFYAIELDKRFANDLFNKYKNYKNVHIINANFLDWIKDIDLKGDIMVLGSIPYYITSPIIHNLIKANIKINNIILMIQKEVAQKICEQKVKPNYFSTFVKTFYNVNYIKTVLNTEFNPVPKVDSAVMQMKLKQESYGIVNLDKYQNFLHKGFKNQKKMLNKVFDEDSLNLLNLTGTLRPHNLDVDMWVKLYFIEKNKNEI